MIQNDAPTQGLDPGLGYADPGKGTYALAADANVMGPLVGFPPIRSITTGTNKPGPAAKEKSCLVLP